MAKATHISSNFTAGQFSPLLEGRVDIAKYENAAKKIENMFVFPQGGVSRRGGTRYIASGKTNTRKVRLVSFEFSTTQAYILEFGNLYIRVYRNQGVIETGSPLAPVEIVTPYTEAQLFELQFTQSADILYIAHPSHEPRTLTRSSHTSWTLALFELIAGPLMEVNITSTTLTPSGTTGSINITASSVTGINDGSGFVAADIDRIIQIDHSGSLGHAKITAITSTTVVVATVQADRDFSATTASATWALGHFYTANWPVAVSFYEQRLVWAGPPDNPQTMAFSVSGDYPNHLAAVLAADAMVYTIATDQVNAIRWMNPGPSLIVGTAGGEFIVSASAIDEALTPTNVRVVRQTTYGSAEVQATRVSNVVLFLQRARRKIREFVYKFETDTFVAPDLNLLSGDITVSGVIQIAYQQEPNSILWCATTDGVLAAMTYQRDQEVIAWHKHIIGGVSDAAQNDAKVESVSVIPATGDDGAGIDEVWISVLRYVDGSEARHIEVITAGMEDTQTKEEAFFVDGGLSLDIPLAITSITQTNPVVVTSSAHGITDGEFVDFREVYGTIELNDKRFRAIEVTTNTLEIMAVAGKPVLSVTKANPGNVESTAHGLSNNDEMGFINVGGMTELNGNAYTITVVDADNFTLGVDTSGFTTFTAGGTAHLLRDGTADTAYISGGTVRVAETAISGLGHFEGESLQVLSNGAVQPDVTVSSGAVTISPAGSIVHIGQGFISKLVLLNIEAGSQDGTAQSKTKRIHQVTVRLFRTLGLKVGPENGSLDTISFRSSSDPMNSSPSLFTGDKKIPYPAGYEISGNIEIRQDQPLPATILAVIAHLKTNN